MVISEGLFEWIVEHLRKNDGLVYDCKKAAQAFVRSPAYAALLDKAQVGKQPPQGEEMLYAGRQHMVFTIAEMAGMDAAEVMILAHKAAIGDLYSRGGQDG